MNAVYAGEQNLEPPAPIDSNSRYMIKTDFPAIANVSTPLQQTEWLRRSNALGVLTQILWRVRKVFGARSFGVCGLWGRISEGCESTEIRCGEAEC